ncbi:hypothetical protein BT63DRAFT_206641 [Microthyrium microscopicum]|uniref:Uncharacterized protein n=1 Tax=Microthyrium microscopicum TaxID=703497 RepID=A0A6A6UFI7_9PEZI|nr:hypothetical protein BT63DRAFT_206641 [Microthyrium microscopicum]
MSLVPRVSPETRKPVVASNALNIIHDIGQLVKNSEVAPDPKHIEGIVAKVTELNSLIKNLPDLTNKSLRSATETPNLNEDPDMTPEVIKMFRNMDLEGADAWAKNGQTGLTVLPGSQDNLERFGWDKDWELTKMVRKSNFDLEQAVVEVEIIWPELKSCKEI